MSSQQVEILVSQAQQLPPDEQLLLIKRIAETLIEAKPQAESRQLVFGKYKNKGFRQSTEEDFRIAEYHPNYEEYE